MAFNLHDPLFLLLLVPLAVLAVVAGSRLGASIGVGRPARHHSAVLALRCASLVLLIVALAQPSWHASGAATPEVIVVDTSASITPAMRAAEVAWLRAALNTMPSGTVRGVVVFAGSARLATLPASWRALSLTAASDPGLTDIENAMRLALGVAPNGGRIVLLSDGLQTTGDALAVAAPARARHVAIDVVALGSDQASEVQRTTDAALTRLQVPAALHRGDDVPLLLTVRSSVARRATLTLAQDGQPAGQETLSLQQGDNPFLATLPAPEPGWHAYHAAVSMAGDAVPQNNALDATMRVIGRPRVLAIATGNAAQRPFVTMLRRLGFDVQAGGPHALLTSAGALSRYDAVVLDDVPATALGTRRVAALQAAVRASGVGLLVLGGTHGFTLGGYTGTALDRILPVLSATPASLQQGNIALELVLDRSGSMNNLAGDEPKILMAQAASNIAVDFAAQHKDDLGIVSFDIEPHLLVALQKVAGKSAAAGIHHAVNVLTADGGTNIFAALRLGLTQILRSAAPYKHIVLMTDGVSDPGPYAQLLTLMGRRSVTLSAIALGADADVNLLRYLAREGKGRFYFTANASDLPHIFANEARLSAGQTRVVGTIPVAVGASSPVLRGLGALLPPVHGYPITALKPDAVPLLVAHAPGHRDDPLLAQWQYGLGRVLAWTPGATPGWAGAWISAGTGFWDDAVRWTLKGVPGQELEPRLLTGSEPLRIEVDTVQDSGVTVDLARVVGQAQPPRSGRRQLRFEQIGPSLYAAPLPDGAPGVYHVAVQQQSSPYGRSDALLAVPYPREYLPRPPDVALLSQLAALTGGYNLPVQPLPGSGAPMATVTDLWWPLMVLALALFMIDVILRRGGRGHTAAPGPMDRRSSQTPMKTERP